MKSSVIEFLHILKEQTPLFDKILIGSGTIATPALSTSHITAAIGWVVGIVTIIFTTIRIIISLEELRERRQRRKKNEN